MFKRIENASIELNDSPVHVQTATGIAVGGRGVFFQWDIPDSCSCCDVYSVNTIAVVIHEKMLRVKQFLKNNV